MHKKKNVTKKKKDLEDAEAKVVVVLVVEMKACIRLKRNNHAATPKLSFLSLGIINMNK